MDLGLEGQRALVGGASRGLGAAIAECLTLEGVNVALAARPSAALDETAARLGASAVRVDLSGVDGPAHAVQSAATALGGLDLLVINSGGPRSGLFAEISDEAWGEAIDGTLQSSIRLLRGALPWLLRSRSPSVLFILSSSVREPIPGLVTSNVLRPALVGFIKSMLTEVAPIRLNAIAPGRVSTARIERLDAERAARAGVEVDTIRRQTIDRVPLGRYGEPAEVGRVATFLLSPAASYVNGAVVNVDGGMIRSLP